MLRWAFTIIYYVINYIYPCKIFECHHLPSNLCEGGQPRHKIHFYVRKGSFIFFQTILFTKKIQFFILFFLPKEHLYQHQFSPPLRPTRPLGTYTFIDLVCILLYLLWLLLKRRRDDDYHDGSYSSRYFSSFRNMLNLFFAMAHVLPAYVVVWHDTG